MKSFVLILSTLLFSYNLAFAQPGILDGDFDADGKVTTNVSDGPTQRISSVLVQPDGKIIAVGYARGNTTNNDFALVRYNIDGTLDNSFSVDGIVTTDISGGSPDYAEGAALQPDGKIVVVGYSEISNREMVVVRYNSDGTLDASFGSNGIVIIEISAETFANGRSIAIQPDGKICLAGFSVTFSTTYVFAVLRLNADGSLDNTFSVNGELTTSFEGSAKAYSMALQSDGKIVVAGQVSTNDIGVTAYSMAVVRYNADGTLDSDFDTDGKAMIQFGNDIVQCYGIAVQNDGKIVLVGAVDDNDEYAFALVRLHTDGSLDNTFSVDGKVITAFGIVPSIARGVAIQADNKILAAGYTNNIGLNEFALVRYNTDGTLDNSFSLDGKVTTEFGSGNAVGFALAIQPNGRIVVGGSSISPSGDNFAVARFISGVNIGILDFATEDGSVAIYPNPINPTSILTYQLEKDEVLSCHVYDMSGKLVQTLFSSQKRQKGENTEVLRATASLPSGNYLVQLDNGTERFSLKVIRP